MTPSDPHLWTIVLAAGDGTRLRRLTRALHGEELPKQFARLHGHESLLERTVRRAARWSPPERTVVVVARDREALAARQLAPHGRFELVAQPRNVGTGPGVLLPLATVLAKDPDARVVVLPSDHYVEDEEFFEATVLLATRRVMDTDRTVLVGAVPEAAEEQYGWIVLADAHAPGVFGVEAFLEKPEASVARALAESGALWSTFVLAARARSLFELARAAMPAQAKLFKKYSRAISTPHRLAALTEIYARMAPADFSRNVLEKASGLEVVPLAPCGWSDWGTPERVLKSLRGTPDHERLLRCLEEAERRVA